MTGQPRGKGSTEACAVLPGASHLNLKFDSFFSGHCTNFRFKKVSSKSMFLGSVDIQVSVVARVGFRGPKRRKVRGGATHHKEFPTLSEPKSAAFLKDLAKTAHFGVAHSGKGSPFLRIRLLNWAVFIQTATKS